MTLVEFIGFFCASFFYVGMLGLQTKFITHSQYWFIVPNSLLISVANYIVVTNVIDNSFGWFLASAGIGSALGILTSTFIHDHWMKKKGEQK